MTEGQPDLEGHIVFLGDAHVGRFFGSPDGRVGDAVARKPAIRLAPPEARIPLARFFEDEGFIWPAELLRHVRVAHTPDAPWTIESVDVFALHRLAVAADTQAGRPPKRRKKAPKLDAMCDTVLKVFGHKCAGLPAIGRSKCDGARIASLAMVGRAGPAGASVPTCRIRGCPQRAEAGLCHLHRKNTLKKEIDLKTVIRGVLSPLRRRDAQKLVQPGFVLGFMGLHGTYFGKPREPLAWPEAKRRGRWLASGGILDDELQIAADLHPTVAPDDVPDLFRALLPDGDETRHLLELRDALAEFESTFTDRAAQQRAWPEIQRHGTYKGVHLRAGAQALRLLRTKIVHAHAEGSSAHAIDECSCTVDAKHGFVDFAEVTGCVAVVNAEFLSWGMLCYVLTRAAEVHIVGNLERACGFEDEDRERILGEPWRVAACASIAAHTADEAILAAKSNFLKK